VQRVQLLPDPVKLVGEPAQRLGLRPVVGILPSGDGFSRRRGRVHCLDRNLILRRRAGQRLVPGR